jgi:DNA-binding transcriptional regulator LsrR (DeoR family)
MRKIREVLRLYYEMEMSRRQIAASLQVAHSTVGDLIRRADAAGVGWPIPESMSWEVTSCQVV